MCEIYKNLSLENIDDEIWKEINGYNGDYFISNLGRVKSFKNNCGIKEKILKQSKSKKGYLFVRLYKNGKSKPKYVHILMYKTFIKKIPEGYIVHHTDFTKNNFLGNFQLMIDNEHKKLHNKDENNPMFGLIRGENNLKSILTEYKVIQIRKLLDEGILTQKEIGKMFGISQAVISNIKNNKSWKIYE